MKIAVMTCCALSCSLAPRVSHFPPSLRDPGDRHRREGWSSRSQPERLTAFQFHSLFSVIHRGYFLFCSVFCKIPLHSGPSELRNRTGTLISCTTHKPKGRLGRKETTAGALGGGQLGTAAFRRKTSLCYPRDVGIQATADWLSPPYSIFRMSKFSQTLPQAPEQQASFHGKADRMPRELHACLIQFPSICT